jgi:hypothetical protein
MSLCDQVDLANGLALHTLQHALAYRPIEARLDLEDFRTALARLKVSRPRSDERAVLQAAM